MKEILNCRSRKRQSSTTIRMKAERQPPQLVPRPPLQSQNPVLPQQQRNTFPLKLARPYMRIMEQLLPIGLANQHRRPPQGAGFALDDPRSRSHTRTMRISSRTTRPMRTTTKLYRKKKLLLSRRRRHHRPSFRAGRSLCHRSRRPTPRLIN